VDICPCQVRYWHTYPTNNYPGHLRLLQANVKTQTHLRVVHIILNMKTPLESLIKDLTEARVQWKLGLGAASRETKILDNVRANNIPNPFHALPDVKHSWIVANVLDPLLCQFNLAKKLTPEMHFSGLSWRTRAANRYLRIMHYRLVKLLAHKDACGFWILACLLMKRSYVIQLVALRKLEPNWHLKMKFGHVLLLIRQSQNTFSNLSTSLLVSREYAHKVKPDGTETFRPLGSPHKAHRMYLYIWQCFFVLFLYSYIGKYQHGFLPGRGVTSAWERVKRIIKLPNVWEFDLKGAFPSVNVVHACRRLTALGTPHPISNFVRRLNLETIERIVRPLQELPEVKTNLQEIAEVGAHPDLGNILAGSAGIFMQRLAMHGAEAAARRAQLGTRPRPVDEKVNASFSAFWDNVTQKSATIGDILNSEAPNPTILGFTQGSGLSPILFDFVFQDAIIRHFDRMFGSSKNYEIVAYADDFIVSSAHSADNIFESSPILDGYNLKISLEKSRPLKLLGAWVADSFKFLGATRDTITGRMWGTPRSGSLLEMDSSKMKSVRFFMRRDRELSKFVRAFPQYANSTSEVLAQWGRNVHPFDLIPSDTITRGAALSQSVLSAIGLEISRLTGARQTDTRPVEPDGSWSGKPRKSVHYMGKLDWLSTPLAGTIMSRLHGGSWVNSQTLVDHDLSKYLDASRTRGRSWYELLGSSQYDHKLVSPTLHNSTSLATLDLLASRHSRKIKLSDRGAHYTAACNLYLPPSKAIGKWHAANYPFIKENPSTAKLRES
jgi:hypothetical protein